jgi:hypothetical protein
MAGMWELPALAAEHVNGDAPVLRLRHSITNNDYLVSVFALPPERLPGLPGGKCFTAKQYSRLPLTGLARKILQGTALASTRNVTVSNEL